MASSKGKVISKGGGIGESKIHRNTDAPPPDIMECHLDGKRIGDLVADGVLNPAHVPLFAITDEGIEQRIAERVGQATSRVEVVRDESDKKLYDQRQADLADDERFNAPKPDVELAKRYTPPGYKHCWMNDEASRRLTTCGYEPAKDEDGKRVVLGDMWLGIKPLEEARKFDKRIQGHTASLEQEIVSAFEEKVDEGYVESGKRPPRASSSDPDRGVTEDSL